MIGLGPLQFFLGEAPRPDWIKQGDCEALGS